MRNEHMRIWFAYANGELGQQKETQHGGMEILGPRKKCYNRKREWAGTTTNMSTTSRDM